MKTLSKENCKTTKTINTVEDIITARRYILDNYDTPEDFSSKMLAVDGNTLNAMKRYEQVEELKYSKLISHLYFMSPEWRALKEALIKNGL